jgi:ABC-type multidrug transport system fused ATPase/permease subunit
MNAIERLMYYGNSLPSEPPRILPTDAELVDWPSQGAIEFKNIEFRYPSRPDYAVLKGITVTFNAGERIGVIGRTGSGKSTLVTTLFRIAELSSGSIVIDGQGYFPLI